MKKGKRKQLLTVGILALMLLLTPFVEVVAAQKVSEKKISGNYSYIGIFSEDLAKVEKDGKCGYINKNGKEVIKCTYNSASNFSDGL